ncbi:putative 2-phosphosulfolactate phosphatase [Bienertia sinuspersici]
MNQETSFLFSSCLEKRTVNLLAARNERESIQVALRPKVTWGDCGTAGVVQVQCNDLISASGNRLVVGESLKIRRVVPILGVPDALVPIDLPISQINLLPGETTALWVSIDVPSEQPPGIYEGQFYITAVKADAPFKAPSMAKAEKHQLFKDLRDCLEIIEPMDQNSMDEAVDRVKSATSNLRRLLLSPSFSEFLSDNGAVDMMEEDAISSRSICVKISLTVWDFVLPATPSLPAVIGVSFSLQRGQWSSRLQAANAGGAVVVTISDTVIEDRFGLEHGSNEWFDALDLHFKWLLQYKISPYFCRWGDGMRVLTYTCPWPGIYICNLFQP